MSIFVNYSNELFSELSNIPTTLIETNSNTIWINSIIVCNRQNATMRFNLKLVKTQDNNPVESFLINELAIAPFKSINVLDFLEKDFTSFKGGVLNLEYSATPSISDSLLCFSNGAKQIFDCIINFTKLNELPIA